VNLLRTVQRRAAVNGLEKIKAEGRITKQTSSWFRTQKSDIMKNIEKAGTKLSVKKKNLNDWVNYDDWLKVQLHGSKMLKELEGKNLFYHESAVEDVEDE
jgi:hypothetical protein